MRLRQRTRLCPPGIALVVLALLLSLSPVLAQEAVTVRLGPVGESEVSGTATLTAAGDETPVTLDIEGLAPNADAGATMHAGTCTLPSASFVGLLDLRADATGRATATGSVLFHGTENIALAAIADGEYIATVHTAQVVACGVIPRLTSAPAPQALPVPGGAASSPVPAAVVVLGFCALSAGLFLRQRGQPS
jgi:hypothetical protein